MRQPPWPPDATGALLSPAGEQSGGPQALQRQVNGTDPVMAQGVIGRGWKGPSRRQGSQWLAVTPLSASLIFCHVEASPPPPPSPPRPAARLKGSLAHALSAACGQ